MSEFVRFPRTPHLEWLGSSVPRGDKVMTPADAQAFLSGPVIVEEKIDGANLGISVDANGQLRLQNRGSYLSWQTMHPQFAPLKQWLSARRERLLNTLTPGLILFGEWCYARHSVRYTRLPDWFVAFDVYDGNRERFWSVERRNELLEQVGASQVPEVARGQFTLREARALLGPSQFADVPAEGIYLRREAGGFLEQRAKLVRAEFTQAIGEHWSRGPVEPNMLG